MLTEDEISRCTAIMTAMSNSHRIRLLQLLLRREMSVSEMNNHLNISQSTLSQHLAVLRAHQIVTTRRQAQIIYYQLTSPAAVKLLKMFKRLFTDNAL